MPTTGAVPGKLIKLWRGVDAAIPALTYAAIGCQTNTALALTSTQLQQACKDAGGWAEGAQGDKSGTVTVDLITKYDVTTGRAELMSDYLSGLTRAWKYGTAVTGDPEESFGGYVSDINDSADVSALGSVSCTIAIVGAVTSAPTA